MEKTGKTPLKNDMIWISEMVMYATGQNKLP